MAVDIDVPRYGAEKTGLLCAHVFAPGAPGREADIGAAIDALSARSSAWRPGCSFVCSDCSRLSRRRSSGC